MVNGVSDPIVDALLDMICEYVLINLNTRKVELKPNYLMELKQTLINIIKLINNIEKKN